MLIQEKISCFTLICKYFTHILNPLSKLLDLNMYVNKIIIKILIPNFSFLQIRNNSINSVRINLKIRRRSFKFSYIMAGGNIVQYLTVTFERALTADSSMSYIKSWWGIQFAGIYKYIIISWIIWISWIIIWRFQDIRCEYGHLLIFAIHFIGITCSESGRINNNPPVCWQCSWQYLAMIWK